MPELEPGAPERDLVIPNPNDEWVCCPRCGKRWFYIEVASYAQILIRCRGCGRDIRVVLGGQVEYDH